MVSLRSKILDKISDIKVLVIGDVMIDSYLFGKVDRISPEAPVPVVSVNHRQNKLGGAANVALNIKELGAEPVLCSVVGDDEKAKMFDDLLLENGMSVGGIIKSASRITTTKFRVIGNKTQMLRVDEEVKHNLTSEEMSLMKTKIQELIDKENIKLIVFEDYDKGVINKELIDFVSKIAEQRNIIVTADPKKNNFNFYKNITLLKPNLKELKEGLNTDFNLFDIDKIEKASKKIVDEFNLKMLMVTLSENGIFILHENGSLHLPTQVRNIADVSGAGDTVISVLSLMLAAGLKPEDAAKLANLAGGLVCEEVGVVPVNPDKLFDVAEKLKIIE